jgi:hypothetical protein
MGKSGELFLQIREKEIQVDDSDYQYHRWLLAEAHKQIAKNNILIKKKKNGNKKSGVF